MRAIYAERGQSAPERHAGQAFYTAGDVARAYGEGRQAGYVAGYEAGESDALARAIDAALADAETSDPAFNALALADEPWIDPDTITD